MAQSGLKSGILVIFFLFSFLLTANAAPLISTFDHGTEEWRVWSNIEAERDLMRLEYDARGFIYAADPPAADPSLDGTWFFRSPASWGGDWTRFIGGTIEWDLNIILAGGDFYYNGFPDIAILGTAGSPLARLRASGISAPVIGEWVNFSIALIPENFSLFPAVEDSGIDFYGVLSSVDSIYIRGEYIIGHDTAGLDNVRVTAVPEPSTLLLLGAGTLALGCVSRRQFRKKK